MQEAIKLHREAIERTYTGKCSIYELQSVRDEVTKITKKQEILVKEELPCKVSFTSIPPTSTEGEVAVKTQSITLFIAPETEIKPGSRIVATQDKVTREYRRSGLPAIYPSHQEISLELFGGYA